MNYTDSLRQTLMQHIEKGADRTREDRIAGGLKYLSETYDEMARKMYDLWGPDRVAQISYEAFPDKTERTEYLTRFAKALNDDEKKRLGNAYRNERNSRKVGTGNAGLPS